MKLQCIIVDDEPVARNGLAEDVRSIPFMQVMGVAESALQAMELLSRQSIDLLFLDIEMPKLNGFDLLRNLKQPPMVILTTAYNHYAPESYELGVIDYLLKPIALERLIKACNKAKDFHELKSGITPPGVNNYIFIKVDGRHEKVLLNELLFVEAADNYILLHTTSKKHLVYRTLKSMEEELPAAQFIKVHKSYIVALDKIQSVEPAQVLIGPHKIPVSRNFKDSIMERVAGKSAT